DSFTTALEDQRNAYKLARALVLDACQAIEVQDPKRAIADVRAMIHIGRCFGDEPTMVSQLMRLGIQSMSASLVGRALAQGQVADEDLAKMQTMFAEEATAEVYLTGLR